MARSGAPRHVTRGSRAMGMAGLAVAVVAAKPPGRNRRPGGGGEAAGPGEETRTPRQHRGVVPLVPRVQNVGLFTAPGVHCVRLFTVSGCSRP
eukprot:5319577-Alexandrium_andersonii.AAC.1